MTETLVRADALSAPEVTPIKGTLLDVATIIENIKMALPDIGLYESYNCLTTDYRASWPCPVVVADPPVQAASSTSTTGGAIPAGTYRFKITALNAQGETLPSNEISQVTTGTTSRITVNWAAVTDAVGYRIFATNGAANSEKLLTQVGNVLTYTWTGTPAIGTDNPPTTSSAAILQSKLFDEPIWPLGSRFTVYAGAVCKKFGGGGAEQLAALSKVFNARESFGVERGLSDAGVLYGATNLTPAGGAVTALEAVGILEGHAATAYAGIPTIHLPRTFATPLFSNGALEYVGNALMTKLGSKVAAGGGYDIATSGPGGIPAPAGQMWVYASGEVLIQRSKIIEVDALDRNTNDNLDLVERTYIVSVDCYASAVLAKVA